MAFELGAVIVIKRLWSSQIVVNPLKALEIKSLDVIPHAQKEIFLGQCNAPKDVRCYGGLPFTQKPGGQRGIMQWGIICQTMSANRLSQHVNQTQVNTLAFSDRWFVTSAATVYHSVWACSVSFDQKCWKVTQLFFDSSEAYVYSLFPSLPSFVPSYSNTGLIIRGPSIPDTSKYLAISSFLGLRVQYTDTTFDVPMFLRQ